MDSGGGYLISNHDIETTKIDKVDQSTNNSSIQVRKLTQKQELRLMNYLDDAFQQIVRGFSKRYTTSSATSLPTLEIYLAKMDSILHIIAEIPPVGPSAQLLINYLLRYTNEITDGIPGYEIGSRSADQLVGDEEKVAGTSNISSSLEKAIASLDLLDRVWSAVLRGNMIDMKQAKEHSKTDIEVGKNSLSFPGLGTPYTHSASHEQHQIEQNQGRYPENAQQRSQRDNHSVVGSRGFSTVGQTQRIRLRNVITLAKENLFAWMRTQLDAPLPPQIEESRKEEKKESLNLIEEQGDLDTADGATDSQDAEEENEIQLEDVKTESNDNYNHYDDLFSRQIDPDAEDEDDEDNTEDDGDVKHGRKRSHTSEETEQPTHKRKHQEEDQTTIAPSDVESEATFRGNSAPNTAAVMRWDVAFARIFQKTLRCLSDIQDRTQRATENEDHQEP
ncbi:uncharacterized protein FA14DRAFT_170530 [Meira miltonrushii]|uniref:Uncharacterized protein n=1 Tax=Meira miltonrushii TaxID=1280837 RepID=A0A316VJL8_9BASI|nr:uncharacterized protein FA14DRAFT_170530 [Meira miltonrushii]PWN37746.1 hypothetical protein FA14DRAFT_170530 [Meira miltonrushii]